MGLFDKIKHSLRKSATPLSGGIRRLWGGLRGGKASAESLEALEELLITADLGQNAASKLVQAAARQRWSDGADDLSLREFLADEIEALLKPYRADFPSADEIKSVSGAYVILVSGVNGCGKTTTIAKLAHHYRQGGCEVLLAGGDAFRAAGGEQLEVWGERLGVAVMRVAQGSSAAGLIFDAHRRAIGEGFDLLIIDTAGRLHNKADLMAELSKIHRVLGKHDVSAPHMSLLVLDATTGKNAIRQAEIFSEAVAISHLVMTKLDGTAKGGVLVALCDSLGLAVMAVGVGEAADDLQAFEPRAFAEGLLGLE